MHEAELWILRVAVLRANHQPADALREAIDGVRRFPWANELRAAIFELSSSFSNPLAPPPPKQ